MRGRVIGIWVSGLLASGAAGLFISAALLGIAIGPAKVDQSAFAAALFVGAPAGALTFVCARLWATTPKMDLPIKWFGNEQ
jgi:uncharacterized membrane protein